MSLFYTHIVKFTQHTVIYLGTRTNTRNTHKQLHKHTKHIQTSIHTHTRNTSKQVDTHTLNKTALTTMILDNMWTTERITRLHQYYTSTSIASISFTGRMKFIPQ